METMPSADALAFFNGQLLALQTVVAALIECAPNADEVRRAISEAASTSIGQIAQLDNDGAVRDGWAHTLRLVSGKQAMPILGAVPASE